MFYSLRLSVLEANSSAVLNLCDLGQVISVGTDLLI